MAWTQWPPVSFPHFGFSLPRLWPTWLLTPQPSTYNGFSLALSLTGLELLSEPDLHPLRRQLSDSGPALAS